MALKRVVVTGLGTINPIGKNVEEYWENLIKGVSGAARITRFNPEQFKTQFACEVKNYQSTDYFNKKEARRLDLFTQFALISAEQAIADANLEKGSYDPERVGVIFASGIGGITTLYEDVKNFVQTGFTPRFNPFFIPKIIIDIAAGYISIKYDFRGPNYGTVSACASSSHAIIAAVETIRLGKADVMITGGSEAPINQPAVGGFNAMHALSTRNDDPATASRPFDKDRDGFVMGEGAGVLVLEEYEHAKKRGAKIYAEIAGTGATADAYHITAPHPEGRGAAKVMELAIKDAGLSPSDVDYINVHGTSTILGDISETLAIKQVFDEHAYKVAISSTKSMIGHLLGGAGAVEAIASILTIKHNIVHPTINLFNLDPKIDPKLNLTPNKPQERKVDVVISNTFGFGGHNACILFKSVD